MDAYSGTPRERFQRAHYLVKTLGSGMTAAVYIYIPKTTADAVLEQITEGHLDLDVGFEQLRGAMGCVKIQDHEAPDQWNLDSEISALQQMNRLGDSRLVNMIDYHRTPHWADWYTLEGFLGRSLEAYAQHVGASSPPAAFGWHMVHQMCGALVGVHFGGDLNGPWPMFFHGDVTWDNLLFRSPKSTATSYQDYPDLVLADFGLAKSLTEMGGDSQSFFQHQYEDVRGMVRAIGRVFAHVPAIVNLKARLDKHERKHNGLGDSNAALKKLLVAFGSEAAGERDRLYVPLSAADTQHFSCELVTNEEIRTGINVQRDQEAIDAIPMD